MPAGRPGFAVPAGRVARSLCSQLRHDLGCHELEMVEVSKVERLQVDTLHAGVGVASECVDHLARRTGQGVGAQLGSVTIAVLAGIVIWAVFYVLIFSEERHLLGQFGAEYRSYMARVPRFFPDFSLWNGPDTLTIRPSIVRATFVDACIFLLSIPIAESFDYLHDLGWVPVLFKVP